MKSHYTTHKLGVYEVTLMVGVADEVADIRCSRVCKRFFKDYKGPTGMEDAAACTYYLRSRIAIIYGKQGLTRSTVAHEIFHATHRAADWAGVEINHVNSEAFAHLNGYITKLVYQDLKKWGIRIK